MAMISDSILVPGFNSAMPILQHGFDYKIAGILGPPWTGQANRSGLGCLQGYGTKDSFLLDQFCVQRLRRRHLSTCRFSALRGPGEEEDEEKGINEDIDELEQALNLKGEIPATSDSFLKQVSSRAYDMRRHLEENLESSSYDVLEANPWRDVKKSVYVLAKDEDNLLTMRTRRPHSEVEKELGMLFPKRGNRRGTNGLPRGSKSELGQAEPDTRFRMVVEDIREGVLVFEDEEEASRYCNLLEGNCKGIAEINASDVFAICQSIKGLAVLFRKGTTPPLPDRLQQNLKARKQSLEDEN